MPDPIPTRRLKLRPVDAELASALARDRGQAGRLAGAVRHRDFPDATLAAMLHEHADHLAAMPALAGWGLWLVEYRPERMIVGGIGFKGPPAAAGEVEIGYAVVRAHRRRGLATEGVAALLTRAFTDGRVVRVLAETHADNAGSLKLLEKLGFGHLGAGADADHGRWELTRTAWGKVADGLPSAARPVL